MTDRDQLATARAEVATAADEAHGILSARTGRVVARALDLLADHLGAGTDPRDLGGAIVDPTRGPAEQGGLGTAVLDASRAVMLSDVETVLVDDSGKSTPLLGILLAGHVNGTDDRVSVLAITDEDGHAALVANLLNAAAAAQSSPWRRHVRYGERFDAAMSRNLADMPHGTPRAGGA